MFVNPEFLWNHLVRSLAALVVSALCFRPLILSSLSPNLLQLLLLRNNHRYQLRGLKRLNIIDLKYVTWNFDTVVLSLDKLSTLIIRVSYWILLLFSKKFVPPDNCRQIGRLNVTKAICQVNVACISKMKVGLYFWFFRKLNDDAHQRTNLNASNFSVNFHDCQSFETLNKITSSIGEIRLIFDRRPTSCQINGLLEQKFTAKRQIKFVTGKKLMQLSPLMQVHNFCFNKKTPKFLT